MSNRESIDGEGAGFLTALQMIRERFKGRAAAAPAMQAHVANIPGLPVGQLLLIEGVDPEFPIVNSQARVNYTLRNFARQATSGTVGIDLGESVHIDGLAPGGSAAGTLAFTPLRPGPQSILLTYVEDDAPFVAEFRLVAAEDSADIDVSTGYILEISEGVVNPSTDFSQDPARQGPAAVCHGNKFASWGGITGSPPTNEWESVLADGELDSNVAISGWVCTVDNKGPDEPHDTPFTHPFFNDWTFYMAPDGPFAHLLSSGNIAVEDENDDDHDHPGWCAAVYASNNQVPVPRLPLDALKSGPAFMEFEMEQGLFGPLDVGATNSNNQRTSPYFPSEGDRVAALGRWIVDCGHGNWTTEIHPPLILARAWPVHQDSTNLTMLGRAFVTSQSFGGRQLWDYMAREFAARYDATIALSIFAPWWVAAIPGIEVRPEVLSPPFAGTQTVMFTVRPPSVRADDLDILLVSAHFTVRTGVSIAVLPGVAPDEIRLLCRMSEADYVAYPVDDLPGHDVTYSVDQLLAMIDVPDSTLAAAGVDGILEFLGEPSMGIILAKGFTTTRYDMPAIPNPGDLDFVISDQVVSELDSNNLPQPYVIDDTQPYPIFGWLNLRWRRHNPDKVLRPDPGGRKGELPKPAKPMKRN